MNFWEITWQNLKKKQSFPFPEKQIWETSGGALKIISRKVLHGAIPGEIRKGFQKASLKMFADKCTGKVVRKNIDTFLRYP